MHATAVKRLKLHLLYNQSTGCGTGLYTRVEHYLLLAALCAHDVLLDNWTGDVGDMVKCFMCLHLTFLYGCELTGSGCDRGSYFI